MSSFMLYVAILLITCVKVTICIKPVPGVPVPGAEVLEDIFSTYLTSEGSLVSYLKGTVPNGTDANYADHNLDINILDVYNVRRLIKLAKKKYEKDYLQNQTERVKFEERYQLFGTTRKRPVTDFRRQYRSKKKNPLQTAGFKTHVRHNPYFGRQSRFEISVEKIYELIQQSIYAAQYRIEDTKQLRSRFVDSPSYKIALLYGACTHYINKMDSLYRQANTFRGKIHFIWYLLIYERMLQANIDLNYAVERIFMIQKTDDKAGLPVIPKGILADQSKYESMMNELDPETIAKMKQGGQTVPGTTPKNMPRPPM